MALPDAYRAIKLLDFNVGAAAAVGFLNPLAIQLDALLALGLGPFQVALAAQFNAAIALQAQLSLNISIGDLSIIAMLRASIAALAQLQVALAASLTLGLPPIQIGVGAELAATAALAVTLQARLGAIQLLIQAALAIKIPAIRASAMLSLALGVGPFFAISFSGTTVQAVHAWLGGEVASGELYSPTDDVHLSVYAPNTFGVLIFGTDPSFQASFDAIIRVPPS